MSSGLRQNLRKIKPRHLRALDGVIQVLRHKGGFDTTCHEAEVALGLINRCIKQAQATSESRRLANSRFKGYQFYADILKQHVIGGCSTRQLGMMWNVKEGTAASWLARAKKIAGLWSAGFLSQLHKSSHEAMLMTDQHNQQSMHGGLPPGPPHEQFEDGKYWLEQQHAMQSILRQWPDIQQTITSRQVLGVLAILEAQTAYLQHLEATIERLRP